MNIKEHISISYDSIKTQLLRTSLTALIIAIGIMALVGILTAIDAIKGSLSSSFSSMGSNSFTIRNSGGGIHVGGGGRRFKRFDVIDYYQSTEFKDRYPFPSVVSVSAFASQISTLKYQSKKTNPNIFIVGADENYINVTGLTIEKGRNFSPTDLTLGDNTIILGSEVARTLFKKESPLDKIISVGSVRYRVVGVLKEKGSSFGMSPDKNCIIPLLNLKKQYASAKTSYSITVKVNDVKFLDNALGEATGTMRTIRGDKIGDEDTFEITKSDGLANQVIESTSNIRYAAIAIAVITLLGASIGLMNIMLVSVTERTREIGIRKSMGATSANIRRQFLTESIMICQIGGLAGVTLGLIIGNLISFLIQSPFIIPWDWMLLGLVICFVVGIISGYYPAAKAARLDPVESLRYE
ncbi:MAG: ABC transporter permease [Bacteroidia bacterium]